MTRYEPAWVFNLVLKMAVVVFLSTLAIGLAVGVSPLTALLRSGAAFGVFAMLAWAASLAWAVPEMEHAPVPVEGDAPEANGDDAAAEFSPQKHGPAEA
jgi:hypothetical protein